MHDSFFIGDTDSVYRTLCREQLKTKQADSAHMQRDPLIKRYQILMSEQYYHPTNSEWQRKFMLVMKDAIIEQHYSLNASWTQLPGMHLREFVSQIDGTLQNYLIYVPEKVSGPLPLVIDMPYAQQPERPFLESALAIGWPQALDDIKRAADHAGIAVAIIDGRGNVGDAPIGEADAFEVLNDLTKSYNIDTHKLYLFGTCQGGRRAIMLAEHYPGVFAAIGTYGPALGAKRSILSRFWFGRHDGVYSQMDNLVITPIKVLQGEYDDVPPKAVLNEFIRTLRKISPSSELEYYPDGTHGTNASEARLFPWLAQHRNASVAPPIQKLMGESLSKVMQAQ